MGRHAQNPSILNWKPWDEEIMADLMKEMNKPLKIMKQLKKVKSTMKKKSILDHTNIFSDVVLPPKKKKIKKKTRTQLKRIADALFSKLVRSRGACQMCTKTNNLQCAHIISRRNLHLRYDFRNALALCAGCHLLWHHEPLWAVAWLQGLFPKNYEYLMKEKDVIEDNFDYEAVIKRLK